MYKKSPLEAKAAAIKFHYGISLFQYNEMWMKQNGVCAICLKAEARKCRWGGIPSLCIDHCHKTGKVRGLLCKSCNTGIGLLNDDPNTLERAKEYLSA